MIRQHKAALLAHLHTERQEVEIGRAAHANGRKPLPRAGAPAYSIVTTCQRYGVLLRIDPVTGDLTIGKESAKAEEPSQPWPSLLMALEAHLDDVATLVLAGWTLKADLPRQHEA
jgi:hypothetical protein